MLDRTGSAPQAGEGPAGEEDGDGEVLADVDAAEVDELLACFKRVSAHKLLLRIAYVTVGPSAGDEGARYRSMAFFSRCSLRLCPARGGGGAGGAHPTTKVAVVEGFLHLNLDLHVVVVQPLKFKGRRGLGEGTMADGLELGVISTGGLACGSHA
ncbi:uncharacterized protein LOC123448492 [Hordeum vulgare subsp. vulgare]|uniref:uncharacterized protein LOC123448492 n=1 Tax=Hordeum vulgare subsp. vulgare TaxID=112509 RepID=UPI001D1A4C67|nr:uncharacterized protein LOC123448492 [Hordeum vulgare subsp. vulgare]XP_044981340.1 uncharacterized protein LOC123448492 [Hordeum vulgare subsp. vulgare]